MVAEEVHIIEGCKKKDGKSQSLLYKKHAAFLYGVALRYTKKQEEAQEVLQDAFIKIFDNIGQYTGMGALRAWMQRIVINQALKVYKVESHRPQMIDFDDYAEYITDESIGNGDLLHHEILLQFIRELPQGYQLVFNMYEIEGYSHEEIAGMLKCTTVSCRSQLFKAKKALRKKIEDFEEKEKNYKRK
jgi:RNA polymerase sigma-70 factor (ECF subfamily)